MSIVGARPQFIKAWPLSRALRRAAGVREILVHTGQHYDDPMSDTFFRELDLPRPDYNLGIGSAGHGAQTGRMMEKLEEIMTTEAPGLAIVFGDTNSTLAGALAAVKLQIPVAHVEAGMRCYDLAMPEEINRAVTDRVASLFFCPTETAVKNLEREGITDNVHLVGDLMVDSFAEIQPAALSGSKILERGNLKAGNYILLTVHRAENTQSAERLAAILSGCAAADCEVIFPVHPRTRGLLDSCAPIAGNIRPADPVSYSDMLALESYSRMIITDSGGVQKEAYLAGVPCLTLRETTEWPETVEAGWNLLVGANPDAIRSGIRDFRPSGGKTRIFGPPGAAERIADIVFKFLNDL
jgi:UDP-N-acetylglucosamine 2-epimerase (non-hydrolysing)